MNLIVSATNLPAETNSVTVSPDNSTIHRQCEISTCINYTGEKIDNVDERMDEMKVGLKVADKSIRELESICGCCYCPCGKPRSVQGTKWYKKTGGKKTKHQEGVVNQQPRSGGGKRGAPQGKYIKTITRDEREVEMEKNLTEVEVIVDNLQGLASDMGNELGHQNEKLTHVNRKTEDNIIHLQSANERLDRV